MCTVEDFRTRFPEFANDATFPDARVQMFLDDAALCTDEDRYGAMYNSAVCYLAAHELAVGYKTSSAPGGSAGLSVGPTSQKTAGGVSVTKAVNSIDLTDGDAYYQQTQYGLKFLSIRDKVKIPGFTVIC